MLYHQAATASSALWVHCKSVVLHHIQAYHVGYRVADILRKIAVMNTAEQSMNDKSALFCFSKINGITDVMDVTRRNAACRYAQQCLGEASGASLFPHWRS